VAGGLEGALPAGLNRLRTTGGWSDAYASIADDYGLKPDEVEQAIRFDELAAA
jgi:hypothetical protein